MKKFLSLFFLLCVTTVFAKDKEILFIAGPPSHGPAQHEHNAGCLLLQKCLEGVHGVHTRIHLNGWPTDPSIFDGVDAVVLYMDGGVGHLILKDDHLKQIDALMKRGVGLGCIHYAVEPTKEEGQQEFLDWIGGAFETFWSVNPHWDADFKSLPKHPVTRGVHPFKINDEWYYHMRFRDGMKKVTPILTAVPPESTVGEDGHHSGNPDVREAVKKHEPQHVMWVSERKGGGRGFGFTGGHFHKNWGDDNFRKVVLNSILWIAKADVPKNGVESTVTPEDLAKNLDPKGPKKKVVSEPAKSAAGVSSASASGAAPSITLAGTPPAPSKPKFKSGLVKEGKVVADIDITGAKKLWLIVTDGGNGYACDWADWAEARLIRADGTAVNLTALNWKSANCGWGEIHRNKNCNGGPLLMGKRKWTDGIGTHAPSIIEYDLPENFSRFLTKAAIDNGGAEQPGCQPQVEFLIYTEPPPANVLQTIPDQEQHSGLAAAKDSLKNFIVADGLEVSLFAAEPMLRNPTDMDIDERGRVWICEGVNYRSTFKPWGILQPAGDRIVVLEDTNGDGVADKATTFYQGTDINAALGICVLGNKAIVSSSPNILVLTDTDGDGKADKKEVLFTGLSGVDDDHGVHAMSFGPDGKLYFNCGNHGGQLMRPDGKPVIDIEGNVVCNKGKPYRMGLCFRCNPDGSEVEVLGHNFRNPYEVCVDSFGTVWQSDNDDDGNRSVRINYVMEHGNFGYSDELTGAGHYEKRSNLEDDIPRRHWHQNDPGSVPNLLITGAGAPTGITVYEGKLLPEIFRGAIIHADAGPRVVRAYRTQPDGAGYKAETVDILTTSDSWFRPSDVSIAPDGSLYVCDWNDAGVGGHNMADHDLATMTGRVYRIAPKGHKPSVPKHDFMSAKDCVAALKSPNNATRYLAWATLHDNQEKAQKELVKMWRGKDQPMRARALQLLTRIHGQEETYLRQAAHDKNPDIRIASLRITRELKREVLPLVNALAHDPSAQVRRECAIALRHNASAQAAKFWAELALQHDGKDRWYLEALGIGADKNDDAFFAAWLESVGPNWNTPAGRDIIFRSRAKAAAAYLVKLIGDPATTEAERPRYFRALDFIPSSIEKETALVNLLALSVN